MNLAQLLVPLLYAVTILPLGDSITTGCQDVTQLDRASYRLLLQDKLREAGTAYDFVGNRPNQCFSPSYDNDHAGHSGYTVEAITAAAEKQLAETNPDIVLLLAGTNNHNDGPDYQRFLDKYSALLDVLGDRPVYAATIPRFGERRFATAWPDGWLAHRNEDWIPSMNAAIREAAAARPRVRVVDFHAALDPAQHLLDDGVHPNLLGQQVLAELFWDAAFAPDLDASGLLGPDDLNLLTGALYANSPVTRYDLDRDGLLTDADRRMWLEEAMRVGAGDANMDGRFDSADLTLAWIANRYETGAWAGWAEGDWNGDLVFDSNDLITAWARGGYEGDGHRHAVPPVPEPTGFCLVASAACVAILAGRRRSTMTK
jgi:lysophospholipase L1-like esterase